MSAAAAASWKSLAQTTAGGGAQPMTIELHPDQPGAIIPPNFVGLSYETQQLSEASFFSPANTGLIAQFRALAPHGVLRLGGNTSDYGFWKPTPDAVPPPRAKRPYKMGDPPPDLIYNVTPEAVRNLRAFLDATGWTCLYGINFGTNTPAIAADEAAFAAKTLGPKLEYFQVGNEADRFGSTIRDPKTWSADTFFDEWLTFANAIRAKVPGAKFGMPDTAGNPEWYAVVVTRLLALPEHDRPEIGALTHHYYFTGPPSNPKANINDLLKPDQHVDKLAADVSAAAARLSAGEHKKVAYRMTEGNSCYRGGKPGLSDVFAASLWSADYLLKLASLGYAGVNLHGGVRKYVAASLGGTLPGEELLSDPDHAPNPRPFYTPIADVNGKFVAEPVSFGMRFAQEFAGATAVRLDFDPGTVNATAYAAKRPDGKYILAIINKDATQALAPTVAGFRQAVCHFLKAPSLTSMEVSWNVRNGVIVGHVPSRMERNLVEGGSQPARRQPLQIQVPPATAVLVDLTE
ncbi:MAG TPA: hypothetical protein VGN01_11410 [Acidobacteriaceae bacterium]